MSETEIREFYDLIREIIETEEFFKMANQKHHIKTSIYDHCLKVAFLCYKHHHKFYYTIKEINRQFSIFFFKKYTFFNCNLIEYKSQNFLT